MLTTALLRLRRDRGRDARVDSDAELVAPSEDCATVFRLFLLGLSLWKHDGKIRAGSLAAGMNTGVYITSFEHNINTACR